MATQLQLRKGTKIQNDAFTGAEAELTYDTTTKGLRIHDGETQGGNLIDSVVFFQAPTAENNYTWARKYASGWVEQGGRASGSSDYSITLPIEMADTNYTAQATVTGDGNSKSIAVIISSTTVLRVQTWWSTTLTTSGITWEVKGMAA